MQFTDLIFLFAFLPILVFIYYIIPNPRYKQFVLITASLIFYACGSIGFIVPLLISFIVDAWIGWFIIRNRTDRLLSRPALLVGVIYNLCLLGYYKYYDFAVSNINRVLGTDLASRNLLLPLGLSFFTFKAISYLADAYRGEIVSFDLAQAIVYLSFFGQIQSGPIARYNTFSSPAAHLDQTMLCKGAVKFMAGFSKKLVLADVLSHIVVEVFDRTADLSTPLAWLGSVCYSLQLFYDFSGYSDMAAGIGNMLGYSCPENFIYPYAAKSVSEFWRRWHVTLGAWFRDYVYIPLGGSRVGRAKLYRNLFVVWALTGIWHGAGWNFVVWGFGYFVVIALEKTLRLPGRLQNRFLQALYQMFTLLIINFQWVLFRSGGLSEGLSFIKAMCVPVNIASSSARALFLLKDYRLFLILAVVFATPAVEKLELICSRKKQTKMLFDIGYCVMLTGVFIIALSFTISGQSSPFLYADF